jgi:hypothetical protein
MIEHYPFEDSKETNVLKELKKVREKQVKLNEELKNTASKDAKDKITAQLKEVN